MKMHENLVGLKPEYIKKRNNRYLIIWPEIPNWLVADKELSEIIKKFDSKTPINEIIKINNGNNILFKLMEMGVLFNKNDGLKIRVNETKIEDVCIHPTLKCNLQCKTCYNSECIPPKE